MKKVLLTTSLMVATVAAFAQGTVNFQNASTTFSGDTSKLLRWADGAQTGVVLAGNIGGTAITLANAGLAAGGLISSNLVPNLRAQLYWGAAGATSFSQLQAVTAAPAVFRVSSSANIGAWNGGTRTVSSWTASVGEHHMLGVIVWDSSKVADGLLAMQGLANGTYEGLYGQSTLFDYIVPATTDAATAYNLNNLVGFNVANYAIIPEPSMFALAGLGGAAMLIFRRRK